MRLRPRFLAGLGIALLAPFAPLFAQPSFTEISPSNNPYFSTPLEEDFWVNATAPADVDGDGDLDLAVIGFYVVYNQSVEDRLVLLRNDGPGTGGEWQFTPVPIPLGALTAGASDLAWGDFDGDGDDDLAVGSNGATVIYRNSAGTLAPLATSLPGYDEDSGYDGAYDLRSLSWADADNDGDLDLLVPSVFDADLGEYTTKLMRNDGPDGAGGWLFADSGAALDGTSNAQTGWADDDHDGDLDLFLVNVDPFLGTGFVRRLGNEGGVFTGQDLLPIRIDHGLADWADYDADGDLDILVAGNIEQTDGSFVTVLRVYRNEGTGYTPIELITAPSVNWLDIHAASWADYDSDGDVDILVTGNFIGATDIQGHSDVFANNGGTFTALGLELPAPISSVGRGGSFTWFDVDGDGDLDYLVAGAYYVPGGNGLVESEMHLYRNGATGANAAPTAPSGLVAQPVPGGVTLTWSPGTDDHTSGMALTYELDLRRAGEPAALVRRLPQPGGLGAVTSWELLGLPAGTYTWSVRTVDSAFNGSPKAEGTFVTGGAGPIFADGFESGNFSGWSRVGP